MVDGRYCWSQSGLIGRLKTPAITDPKERARVFGQADHVRNYGPDYVDRLRKVGFNVKVSAVNELFGQEEANLMGLTDACGEIFYCTKGACLERGLAP